MGRSEGRLISGRLDGWSIVGGAHNAGLGRLKRTSSFFFFLKNWSKYGRQSDSDLNDQPGGLRLRVLATAETVLGSARMVDVA